MKPRTFLLPPPQDDHWKLIMRVYGVPDYKYSGKPLTSVMLPSGWFVMPHPDTRFPNSWYIYSEDCEKAGEFYYDEKMGFIKFEGPFIKKLERQTFSAPAKRALPKSPQEQYGE